jgi:hypothetical protein
VCKGLDKLKGLFVVGDIAAAQSRG